jgi:hypothetical protein
LPERSLVIFVELRPVTIRYKKPFDDGSKPIQYGLIAEEVAQAYPDPVARSADGQIETVKYQLLDSMLLNEVQKQKPTIKGQKEQIHSQEREIRSQQQDIHSLETGTSWRPCSWNLSPSVLKIA